MQNYKSVIKSWKKTGIILFFILLFAFLIRIYHLTNMPVFADEAIYIRWSQIMSAEPTLRFLPLSDGKQPMYMWILMFVVKRFSDPLFVGRFVSVLSGLATIIGIFGSSVLLFKSKKVGLLAAFLWAVSPFSFFFDRMALVDSMLAAFGIWIFFLGIITARTRRLDAAMLTGFTLGGALLTKSPAIFFVILLPSLVLISDLGKDVKKRSFVLIKLFGLLLVAYIIGYGMYSILRLGPNFHLIGQRNQDYVLPYTHILTNPWDPFIFHIQEVFTDWLVRLGPVIVLLIAFLAVFINIKKRPKEVLLIIAWFIVPILVQSMYAKVFTARYLLFCIPYLLILAGSLILVKNKIYLKIATLLFIVFAVWSLRGDYLLAVDPQSADLPSSERSGYLEEWTSGYGIRDVAAYLRNQYLKNPSQQIVAGTEGYFGTLPDGLQMYLDKYPKILVIGVGLDIKEVPQSLLDAKKAGNPTYLVINSSRLKTTDWEKIGLKLIAAYPKAMRREKATHEYLWYGPQETLYLFEVTSYH